MKHATKLPISIDLFPLVEELLAPHQKYYRVQKYARNLDGTSIPYTETLRVLNEAEFVAQLPEALVALEWPSVFVLELPALDAQDPVLPAHVDINKTCGINVYLDTHGEVTKFYQWSRGSRQSEYVEEFCADAGDVWLMDTSVPHSVDMVPNKSRRMLTFSFTKAKYAEVLPCFATN
jgi:hypothetical protein